MSTPVEISAELLINAYAAGVFPMGSEDDPEELYWLDPPRRGIIPLDEFRLSRSMRKRVRQDRFEIAVDRDFDGTLRDCAGRRRTWINETIVGLYSELHRLGFAHSVEAWRGGARVGGLYGVRLGAAFFGESMFSRETDASKVALVHLVARMKFGGMMLLDTQFTTDHLETFGAREISRSVYRRKLNAAVGVRADFFALPDGVPGARILELSLSGSGKPRGEA